MTQRIKGASVDIAFLGYVHPILRYREFNVRKAKWNRAAMAIYTCMPLIFTGCYEPRKPYGCRHFAKTLSSEEQDAIIAANLCEGGAAIDILEQIIEGRRGSS